MELPNVPIGVRREALSRMMLLTDFCTARVLESYCHANRCRSSRLHDIPCWNYNDAILFETDRIDLHIHYAHQAYCDNVLRVVWLLRHGITGYYATPENTAYDVFKAHFHDTIASAKTLLAEKSTSSTGLFKCPRCKSMDVDTEQKQTRSADEPMTIFCNCTRCDMRFTIK